MDHIRRCIILLLLGTSLFCKAQFTDILNFNDTVPTLGAHPCGSLLLSGKTLFGMTKNGGANDSGCIFSVDTNGNNYKDLLDFNSINGTTPYGSLVLSGKTLFGMTNSGGVNYDGRIFSIDTTGNNYKLLIELNGTSTGKWPVGSLTLMNKKLYGMTNEGGANDLGTIFSIDTSGNGFKDLFDCTSTSGQWAWGDVAISGNKLFGMFSSGGIYSAGTLFSLDTAGGGFKVLKAFDGNTCASPQGSLIASGSMLFGMTELGGTTYGDGNIFSIDTSGANYKNLFNFSGASGKYPAGTLSISGKTLVGMTQYGGAHDSGCIFSIDTDGSWYTHLFDFNGANGSRPYLGHLTISGNVLYGMTNGGGADSVGVIFRYVDNVMATNNIESPRTSVGTYPNPSEGIFSFLGIHALDNNIDVEIYNVLGKQILKKQVAVTQNKFEINIADQPAGIYFYSIKKIDGTLLGSGKLSVVK